MKKLLLAIFTLLLIGNVQAQDETIFSQFNFRLTGAWGGTIAGLSKVGDGFSPTGGGYGLLEFDKQYLIGWGGSTISDLVEFNGRSLDYDLDFNGLIVGYSPQAFRVVHPRVMGLIGSGRARVEGRPDRTPVLQFEGDRNYVYRILRALKNRFGSTSELGIYEMQGGGLRQVNNPSEILISKNDEGLSGTAIASTVEGMRPLMIEIQALVSTAVYGTPQRSTTGYNGKRLNMLLAVLEKRAGFKLGAKDVFLNITGGISVDDPAIDLAVIAAILSSNEDIPIEKGICFAAEVGLAGEIRPVQRIDQRILEAEKLGFTTIYVSKNNKIGLKSSKIEVLLATKIEDVVSILFG